MDEDFEQYFIKEPEEDFEKYFISENVPQQHNSGFLSGLSALGLGLGQGLEDLASSGADTARSFAEGEVDFPEHWKPEKIRKGNVPERTPYSFNLKQYVNPKDQGKFTLASLAPLLAGLAFGGYKGRHIPERIYTGISNERTGSKILEGFKKSDEVFNKRYGEFFEKTSHLPRTELSKVATAKELKEIKRFGDFEGELSNLGKNPSVKQLHELNSDLMTFIRKLEKTPEHELYGKPKEALKAAQKISEKIKHEITKSLSKEKGLAAEYKDIQHSYKKEHVPYLTNKDIQGALKQPGTEGYIYPSRIPEKLRLQKGDPFTSALSAKHPELAYNEFLRTPFKRTAWGAAGLLGGNYAFDHLFKK